MTAAGGPGFDAALGLLAVLEPVLADVAGADAVRGARATAQALGLAGLERLLEACAPRAGLAWPAELVPALDRVRRLAAQARAAGDLAPFREADRELAGLADEISALRWSTGRRPGRGAARPVATLGLSDALDDLPLADDASRELARRARVVPPVAAALRAALDWITGGSARPLALRAEDSVLEVRCEHVEPDGLAAAAEVLASVGANLGPGPAASDPWVVRVPLQTDREIHLMIVCGGVPVAIPWHAVLRLHMAGAAELAGRASAAGPWCGTRWAADARRRRARRRSRWSRTAASAAGSWPTGWSGACPPSGSRPTDAPPGAGPGGDGRDRGRRALLARGPRAGCCATWRRPCWRSPRAPSRRRHRRRRAARTRAGRRRRASLLRLPPVSGARAGPRGAAPRPS